MKCSKSLLLLTVSAAVLFSQNVQAQFGGLKKLVAAPQSPEEKALLEKATPASVLLQEASDLYRQALNLKKEAAKADVKGGDIPAVKRAKQTVEDSEEIKKAMDGWKQDLTAEQKALCAQAHGKLTEGSLALAAVSAPTALEIKKITDANPAGLAQHPDLAMLGILCAKDSVKLMSFVKVATDFNKKWNAPVSDKKLSDIQFTSN